jgi:hypothetical protein
VSSEKLLRTCFEPAAAYMPGRLSEHLLLPAEQQRVDFWISTVL